MAKLKRKSAAKKRFKKVGNGKIKRARAYHRHHFSQKNAKRKRSLRKGTLVSASDEARVRMMLR